MQVRNGELQDRRIKVVLVHDDLSQLVLSRHSMVKVRTTVFKPTHLGLSREALVAMIKVKTGPASM